MKTETHRAIALAGTFQAAYLASVATVAVFAGDKATLARLSTRALQEPDVRSIVFYDREGHILLSAGDEPSLVEVNPGSSGTVPTLYTAPVY